MNFPLIRSGHEIHDLHPSHYGGWNGWINDQIVTWMYNFRVSEVDCNTIGKIISMQALNDYYGPWDTETSSYNHIDKTILEKLDVVYLPPGFRYAPKFRTESEMFHLLYEEGVMGNHECLSCGREWWDQNNTRLASCCQECWDKELTAPIRKKHSIQLSLF